MNYPERIQVLKAILVTHKLDIILAYSTRFETSMSKAFTGTTCRSAGHYFFCTLDDHGFFEVEYKVADLKERSKMKVIAVSDENVYGNFLNEIGNNWKKIGVLGSAPFSHFLGLPAEILDLTETVWPMLRKKNPQEIKQLSEIYKSLKSMLETTVGWIQPGMTELELEKTLKLRLLENADSLAFDPIVCSGDRLIESTFLSASHRELKLGEYVCIDAGIVKDGLFTDCTRMFQVGGETSEVLLRFQLAHQNVISSIKAGMLCADLETHYKRELTRQKLPAETLNIVDLGHFIGLKLHEPPFFITFESNNQKFEETNVFCLEPQITVDGFKIRIEDMITIKKGRAINLAAL